MQLSAEAELGRKLFFDVTLSASGKLACSSCHDPNNAYAAPNSGAVVMRGGAKLDRPGLRAVPSLRYLAEMPLFSRHGYRDSGSEREDVGPAGGFMLDGRADSLHKQALLPLFDPAEMANSSFPELAERLRRTPYSAELLRVFDVRKGPLEPGSPRAQSRPRGGVGCNEASRLLVEAAAQALERFELEDPSFHPYNSRYDQYLRGMPTLSARELEGLKVFVDPEKGNCAACHTVTTGPQGRPPDFTDYSYHALGVPRNPAIPANSDPHFFDLGLCGPLRTDLRQERQYCGYFRTPTLRNVARRRYFFHNGRFNNLTDVVHFYIERSQEIDDLPARYRVNVDTSDAPLNRGRSVPPILNEAEIEALVAFLRTLDDAD